MKKFLFLIFRVFLGFFKFFCFSLFRQSEKRRNVKKEKRKSDVRCRETDARGWKKKEGRGKKFFFLFFRKVCG